MKNTKLKSSKLTSFLTGKGFYIAICLSIAVVSATAYFVINATRNNLTEQNNINMSVDTGSNEWAFSGTEVSGSQSDVPKESSEVEEETSEVETDTASESQSTAAQPESSSQTFSNTFVMPLKGEIINEYSNGKPVKSKTLNEWRTHDGVDIKADIATPVKAASDGVVTAIDEDPMWGVCITIDHGNGYVTRYGHNSSLTVSVGEHVYKGQQIARVGSTGNSTGNHCHFEIRYNGVARNPLNYLP